jgi:hypothetical protein
VIRIYNGKPTIATALSTDVSLVALIPKVRMFDGAANFTTAPTYPYLTYSELANIEALHADDDEVESEVTFRIHLWGTASLSTIAGHVNRIMRALGYGRNYSNDQDEQLDTGQNIKHKIMSFTGIFTA